ncbi:MAG TPA: 1-(5-phosphoribosyl)-5-[(5-phosphoribosylamino)methylideneamino] imidazole-4-carboxamide isomerase [Candidatus Thermoplasmatota archaeon]|nr:1-(5-phosphoribosyl)-5-[(5-phosphoribosylamino)methylideneamino] imidazole-4-carboxamide isomerase [Candidatus Thermoplasmatota archaeon]
MILYPAIDLRHGKVVQLVGGDPRNVAVERPDVDAQAKAWEEAKATWVHVVDLDAAFGEKNQWSLLTRVLGRRLHVQFGGGIRSMTQIQQLLELGVERVVVGTQGVRNPEWLRELCVVFPGRIVLAVDARGRNVVVKGWTEDTGIDVVTLARSMDDAKLAAFLYTNVDKEGRLQGMDKAVISDLRNNTPKTPLLVSGGISGMADLQWLSDHGIDGAVLGMSIYTGAVDLKAAVAAIPQPPYRARRPQPLDPDDDLDDEVEEGPTDGKGFIQVLRAREEAGDEE